MHQQKTIKFIVLVLVLVFSTLLTGTALAAHGPAGDPSGDGIQPTFYVIAPGPQPSCRDLGGTGEFEVKIEPVVSGDYTDPNGPLNVKITVYETAAGTLFHWSLNQSNVVVNAVLVKGGTDANLFVYNPADGNGDTALHAPVNPQNDKYFGLSHLSFCYDKKPAAAQWCSPGYWKQPHHLGSWAATGISPYALYNTYFNPDLPGNPTLLYVLQNPQKYQRLGGDPINRVGDLLSAAHPNVNFTGQRVENSCPLGRNPG